MKIVRDIFVLDKDVTREAIVNAAPQVQAMAKSGQIKGFVALAHGIRYGLDVVPLPKGVEYQDLTPLAGKPAEILKPADAARQPIRQALEAGRGFPGIQSGQAPETARPSILPGAQAMRRDAIPQPPRPSVSPPQGRDRDLKSPMFPPPAPAPAKPPAPPQAQGAVSVRPVIPQAQGGAVRPPVLPDAVRNFGERREMRNNPPEAARITQAQPVERMRPPIPPGARMPEMRPGTSGVTPEINPEMRGTGAARPFVPPHLQAMQAAKQPQTPQASHGLLRPEFKPRVQGMNSELPRPFAPTGMGSPTLGARSQMPVPPSSKPPVVPPPQMAPSMKPPVAPEPQIFQPTRPPAAPQPQVFQPTRPPVASRPQPNAPARPPIAPQPQQAGKSQLEISRSYSGLTEAANRFPKAEIKEKTDTDAVIAQKDKEIAQLRGRLNEITGKLETALRDARR
ncbi:MAG: hypothetical protein FWD58_07020 [Firmicutes bacterium]|nr:hypothetical protein [Bacillota bacterium]